MLLSDNATSKEVTIASHNGSVGVIEPSGRISLVMPSEQIFCDQLLIGEDAYGVIYVSAYECIEINFLGAPAIIEKGGYIALSPYGVISNKATIIKKPLVPPAPQPVLTKTDSRYRIAIGDRLLISEKNGPSRVVQVDWKGMISLPDGRDLSVYGRPAEDVASDLETLLEYHDAIVTILYVQNTFILIGPTVRSPGRTEISHNATASQLVSLINLKKHSSAKGFFRRGNSLEEIEISEKMSDFHILPDDIVVIP